MSISETVAKPSVQIAFLVFCILVRFTLGEKLVEELTYWLSVFAISLALLLLMEQNRDTKAIHLKLDEIDEAIPESDGKAVGIEKQLRNHD